MCWAAAPAAIQAFAAMKAAADRQRAEMENRHIQESHAKALGFYGKPGDKLMGFTVFEDPCDYCGRESQTNTHKSCDGCGAPKHRAKPQVRSECAYGWAITRPGEMVKIRADQIVAGTITADRLVV